MNVTVNVFEQAKLPRASELIINALKTSDNGVQTQAICEKTRLSKRQVRYVLDLLLKQGLVIRLPNLHDLRVNLYSLTNQQN